MFMRYVYMYKRIFLMLFLVTIICRTVFAGYYIADNRITYIGETDKYHCYIYDADVNLVIRFSDFHKSGNWSATVVLNPKTEEKRNYFVEDLNKAVQGGSFDTMLLPNRDNELWSFAIRVIYDNQQRKLFLKDNFYLNCYGEIIAQTRTEREDCPEEKYPATWKIKDLMDKHIHKRYQEEYERRNTVVR